METVLKVYKKLRNWIERNISVERYCHIELTKALLKFIDDHGVSHPQIRFIRETLYHLERNEASAAKESFKKMFWGKESLQDLYDFPDKTFENETKEYNIQVYGALLMHWYDQMNRL